MERFAGDMAVTILLSYLVILGILAIGCIASYLLRGIGMYTLGKRRGMNYPWLAFIPYARTYFQGELCASGPGQSSDLRKIYRQELCIGACGCRSLRAAVHFHLLFHYP